MGYNGRHPGEHREVLRQNLFLMLQGLHFHFGQQEGNFSLTVKSREVFPRREAW